MYIIWILFGAWILWAIWDKWFKKSKRKPNPSKFHDNTEAYLSRKRKRNESKKTKGINT